MERYIMIFSASEIGSVDFSQILEDSPETLRFSVDGTKTLVKWQGTEIPSSVNALTTKEGPYDYQQSLTLLNSLFWNVPDPLMPI
jgi:hypothetical protein